MTSPEQYRENQAKLREHNARQKRNRAWQWAICGGIPLAAVIALDVVLSQNQVKNSQEANHFAPVPPATSTPFPETTTTTMPVETTITTTEATTTTTPAVDTVRQTAEALLKQYVDCKPYFTSNGPNTLATFTPGLRADDNVTALRSANAGNTTYRLHPAEYTLQGLDKNGNTVSLPQGGSYSVNSPATVHLPSGANAPKKYEIVVTETEEVNDPATSPYRLVGNLTCAQGIQFQSQDGTWRPNGLDQVSGGWDITER